MPHIKRGEAISGTDVAHFFSPTPKVGQPHPNYCEVSMREISNGSPGWGQLLDFTGHIGSKPLIFITTW